MKKEIGEKWGYSNLAVGLLGNLLGEILGLNYEAAITSQILEPLGMKDTFVTGDSDQNRRYMKAYNKKGEEVSPFLVPAMNGTGALKSTMHDMLMFLEHQMNIHGSPFKDEIDFTHKIHTKTQWKNFNMGLGWIIERRKWSRFPIIHHDGATVGFHTYCGFIKEKQIGTVICSTAPLRALPLIKKLLGLTGMLHEDIAKTIFINSINSNDE